MVLKDCPLRQKTFAGDGVLDHVGFVDGKVHVEDDVESFLRKVALAGDLKVNVDEQFQALEGVLQFGRQGIAVGRQVHIAEVDRRSGRVPQVRVLRVDGRGEVVDVAALFIQEGHDGVDIKVGLKFVHTAVGGDFDRHVFLQVLDELAQVLAAVVLQDIDELRHVAENVGGHGRLPVDVVDQVLDEVAKGKFLFVVLQPDDRDGVPVVGLVADGEMGFGVVVGFVAVFGVDDKVPGDGAGEGVGFEILDAAGPPQFGVGDRVLSGADVDHLVIEANEGVQLRSLRIAPDRDQFRGRDSHEGQFPVVEVGLKPCNTRLHGALPQGFDLPAEGLVEDVVQGVAVGTVLRVHGEGLPQKVVRLLVDQLLQNRVFDPGIRPVRDVIRLPLDVGPVSVIGFGLDHVRVLFGRLELPDLFGHDLGQGHCRVVRIGNNHVDPVHNGIFGHVVSLPHFKTSIAEPRRSRSTE